MEARELIKRARERGGYRNQTELAKALGINQSSLSLMASGKGEVSDETWAKAAEIAGLDPSVILVEKHLAKAKGDKERKAWQKIAQKMAIAGLTVSVLGMVVLPDQQVRAETLTNHAPQNIYYATFR